MTLEAIRYWDGNRWTAHVRYNGRTFRDETPLVEIELAADRADAAIVKAYLDDAARRSVVPMLSVDALRHDLDAHYVHPRPVGPQLRPRPQPVAPPAPQPVARPVARPVAPSVARPAPRPAPVAVRNEPGAVAEWWARSRKLIAGDLAVHGLAYLGVVLMFAGVFGLIAFSLGDVQRDWRGLAIIAAPMSFLGAAAYLRRRHATAVAAAMSLLGAALLPIVGIAVYTDGSRVPAELHGTALPIAQSATCAAIALLGWLAVRRWPTSMYRHTIAPTAWLGVGVLVGLTRNPIPTGQAVARPVALQFAAMLAAVAVTGVALRIHRGDGATARATARLIVPAAALCYGMEAMLAAAHGWPVNSGLVAAVAALVLVELWSKGWPNAAITLAELSVITVGAARLLPETHTRWWAVGLLAMVLAVLEHAGSRRPSTDATACGLLLAAGVLAVAAGSPGSGLAATSLATAWLVGRRVARVDWLPLASLDPYGIAPAAGTAAMALEHWRLTSERSTVLVLATAAVMVALTRRVWPAVRSERLTLWWPVAAGLSAAAVTIGESWNGSRGLAALTVAFAAVTFAWCELPLTVRTWGTALLVVGAGADLGAELGTSRSTQSLVLAAVAAAAVVLGLALHHVVTHQLALLGHVAGCAAIAVPNGPSWTTVATVGLATVAWLATTAVHEVRGARHLDALWPTWAGPDDTGHRVCETVLPLITLTGLGATAVLTLHVSELVPLSSLWTVTTISHLAVLTAVAARILPWRRALPWLLHGTAVTATVVAAVATAARASGTPGWPTITAVAAALVTILVGSAPRPFLFVWLAWAETGPLAVLTAMRAGLAERWVDVTVAAWGTALMMGALLFDRVRHGRAEPSEPLRDARCVAPATLGGAAAVIGIMASYANESLWVQGWLTLAVALLAHAVALVRPLPALSLTGHVAMTGAGLMLLHEWAPLQHPWSLVIWCVVLLAIAQLTRDRASGAAMQRWDLPAFLAAHAVAVVALATAPDAHSLAITAFPLAALALIIAALVPHPAWNVAAAALTLLGAFELGLGWLSLALAVEGAVLTAVGLHRTDHLRLPLVSSAAGLFAAAWAVFVVWREWSTSSTMTVSALVSCTISLVTAFGLRHHRQPRVLLEVWFATGCMGTVVAAALLPQPGVARLSGGLTIACALAVLSVAVVATISVHGEEMRWVATAPAAASLAIATWALDLAPRTIVHVGSGLALTAVVALTALHAVRPRSPWLWPAFTLVVAAQIATIGVHLSERSTPLQHVEVLLVLAGELAALSVMIDQPQCLLGSAGLACTAWLVFAADHFHHEPNWFTIPIGVTLLVMVSLVRWIRRTRGGPLAAPEIVLVEFVGMTFVVAAALVRVVQEQLWYSLMAIALGVLLSGWGVVTRVRRRAAFGAATVLLAAALVVGVPLVRVVPHWRGAALWLAIAGVGAAAILVATLLEQGRQVVRHLAELLAEMTQEWEIIGKPVDDRRDGSPPKRRVSASSG